LDVGPQASIVLPVSCSDFSELRLTVPIQKSDGVIDPEARSAVG
jgi:hypothetical protein